MRAFISIIALVILPFNNAALAAGDKPIASLANEPIGVGNYLQMFFGLFIIVALIIGLAWFMRRMGNMNSIAAGNLKVIGGLSIGQRERIVLVQAGNTQLLVGVAPGEIRTLHVMDDPIVPNEEAAQKKQSGFAEKLHAAIKNRSGM